MTMVRKILAEEGVVGFARGIGAAVYGNYCGGFILVLLYKYFKMKLPESPARNMLAASIAEAATIVYKFPLDLVKCRIQSVNYIFKYSNWRHGLMKEFRQNGIKGLYKGVFPYFLTGTSFKAL